MCEVELRGCVPMRLLGIMSVALLVVVLAPALAAEPQALPGKLAGRWTGWGKIAFSSGASEQVRCVTTYDVASDGTSWHQTLRCASASYRVDTAADLSLAGGDVSGAWREAATASEGRVRGRATEAGLNLDIEGTGFSASLVLVVSECRQSIAIAPRGLDIERIAITLQKC
jgi:hypothetical protein